MVRANRKDEAPKSELSREKDKGPLNSSRIMEKEEYYKEEEEDDEGEAEEENVNNGGNTMVVVNAKDKKKAKEPKNSEKTDVKSKSKGKRCRIRNKNRKHDEQKGSVTLAVNGAKPESANGEKGSKRVETMGMVFMCSSKTKTDCFRYKILGLPDNKRDQVLKIYSGMRLFLFDVDLRLMYGIFKADGPGGYNIEPEAFNSEFPSQVRFAVMEDCLPLAEEKFKDILKENYHGQNTNGGLRSLLKSDQVKKLCKLFKESELLKESSRGKPRKSSVKARKAKPIETHPNQPDDRNTSQAREKRKRRGRDEERCPRSRSPPVREKRRPRSRSPLVGEKMRYADYYHDHPNVLYDREPCVVPGYHPAPPTATVISPVRVYTYERQHLDIPPYVRDYVPEHHTYRVIEERSRDPEPMYSREQPLYRDAVYVASPEHHFVSRDYSHPSAIQTPEYRITGGSRVANYHDVETASDYRSSALQLPDHRSALPLSNYRSALPLSDYRSALPLSDSRFALPPSDYRSALQLCDYRSALSLSDSRSALPLSDSRSALPVSDYRSALPVSDYRSALPLSDYRSSLPLSDYRSALPLSDYRSGTLYRY